MPEKNRPDIKRSLATCKPTIRVNNLVEPNSGAIPLRTNANWSFASWATNRTSHVSGKVRPTPTAWPFIAATTGFDTSQGIVVGVPCSWGFASGLSAKVSSPSERSCPAQNARPEPVMTTARTWSSVSASESTEPISAAILVFQALRRSGRFNVRRPTPWSTS